MSDNDNDNDNDNENNNEIKETLFEAEILFLVNTSVIKGSNIVKGDDISSADAFVMVECLDRKFKTNINGIIFINNLRKHPWWT